MIKADPISYTPAMSSVRGITLTPDFETKKHYKDIEYHWETGAGEFIGMGQEGSNQGESVIWSAVENGKIAEIKDDFDIKLEVTEAGSKEVLAAAKVTITTDNGFYKIKE
jgi:hypothetical protein